MSTAVRGIGRRGAVLVLFACVYIVFGFAIAGVEPARPGMELVTRWVPLSTLGFFWILSGVIAVGLSAPSRSWAGYGTLMAMPLLWGLTNAAAYIIYACNYLFGSALPYGASIAWAGALVWGLIVGVLGIVAGWPEVPVQGAS